MLLCQVRDTNGTHGYQFPSLHLMYDLGDRFMRLDKGDCVTRRPARPIWRIKTLRTPLVNIKY